MKTRHFVSAKTVCALLERHLGVSKRTNIATRQVRAAVILTTELAYMPSLLPPPELPLTQHFGGQATVVNAGTLKRQGSGTQGRCKKADAPRRSAELGTSAKKRWTADRITRVHF